MVVLGRREGSRVGGWGGYLCPPPSQYPITHPSTAQSAPPSACGAVLCVRCDASIRVVATVSREMAPPARFSATLESNLEDEMDKRSLRTWFRV